MKLNIIWVSNLWVLCSTQKRVIISAGDSGIHNEYCVHSLRRRKQIEDKNELTLATENVSVYYRSEWFCESFSFFSRCCAIFIDVSVEETQLTQFVHLVHVFHGMSVSVYTYRARIFFSRCLSSCSTECLLHLSLVPNDTCDFEIHIGMSIRTGKKLTTTATTKDTKTEYHKTLTSDENEYEFAAKLSTVSHSFFQPLFLFQFSEWMFYWQLNNSQFTMDCCMLFGPTKNKVESQRISIFCWG